MTTCALYLRISLDKTGEGAGIERQERECREYAQRHGLDVGDVHVDNDTSATSGVARPGFEALLKSKPEAILTWHQDRLLRLSKDLERVIALDVPVYTVTAGTLDLTTPAGRAVARTVAAWSQYEGEQKAVRMRAKNKQKAEAGKPHWVNRPFGYNRDGSLNEPEAALVRQAYRDIIDGASLQGTARKWNTDGVTTTGGKQWRATTLRALLRSERNAGIRLYRGIEHEAAWPAIVDRDTWAALCAETSGQVPKGAKRRRGLLSGVATCWKCGHSLVLGGARGRTIYRCISGVHISRTASLIDNAVVTEALNLLVVPGMAERMSETERPDADKLRAERLELDRRRTEWLQSGMAPKDVATALKPLDARLEEINKLLVGNIQENPFAEWWTHGDDERLPLDAWEDLPLHTKQALLQGLFSRIEPQPGRGGSVIVEPTPKAAEARQWLTGQIEEMAQQALRR
ncbi:Site-specific DNA recombinase [Micrococcales bacterium KH10]|nr:Site-specific DNA recombinase [Micrococcales bacterium KH10]